MAIEYVAIITCDQCVRETDRIDLDDIAGGVHLAYPTDLVIMKSTDGFFCCLECQEEFFRNLDDPRHAGDLLLSNLTQLSDAAAESISEHEGDQLYLSGLTELSDAAAQSLANKESKLTSWHIRLDNLPASAAKILRDAGHGE